MSSSAARTSSEDDQHPLLRTSADNGSPSRESVQDAGSTNVSRKGKGKAIAVDREDEIQEESPVSTHQPSEYGTINADAGPETGPHEIPPLTLEDFRGILLAALLLLGCIILGVRGYGKFRKDASSSVIASPSVERLRLSATIIPVSYRLQVYNISLQDLYYSGNVEIAVTANDSFQTINLHASSQLRIYNVTVRKNQIKNTDVMKPRWKLKGSPTDFLALDFAMAMSPGNYSIYISYDGDIGDRSMNAFYRSEYIVDSQKHYVAATHFEPISARRAFPCFDEPALKAVFHTSVCVHPNYNAISNSPPLNTTLLQTTGEKCVHFAPTKPISSYLVAWAVHKYNIVSRKTTRSSIEVNIYTPPGREKDTDYAMSIAIKTIDLLEFLLDYPLPTSKMDMIPLPDFSAEGMENMNLITYDMEEFLTLPTNDQKTNQTIALLVAHELAHHWFGNLVTMSWWNDLWLNEGFAEFFQYISIQEMFEELDMISAFYVEENELAFYADAPSNSHPIRLEIASPIHAPGLFDDISYDKGASVLKMAKRVCFLLMTQNSTNVPRIPPFESHPFFRGLSHYLKKHEFGVAGTPEVWESIDYALRNVTNDQPSVTVHLQDLMGPWITRPGFPIIFASLNKSSSTLHFSQSRFTLWNTNLLSKNESDDEPWPVVIEYRIIDGPSPSEVQTLLDASIILATRSANITLPVSLGKLSPNALVLVNPLRHGFYRIWYDRNNTAQLWNHMTITPRNSSTLEPVDRAGFISDQIALALSDRTTYFPSSKLSRTFTSSSKFSFVTGAWEFLRHETSMNVWRTAGPLLESVLFLFDADSSQVNALQSILGDILKNVLADMKIGRTHSDLIQIRGEIQRLSFLVKEPSTIHVGMHYFDRLMKHHSITVPNATLESSADFSLQSELKMDPSLYCGIGIRYGSTDRFDSLLSFVKHESSHSSSVSYGDWLGMVQGLASSLVPDHQTLVLDLIRSHKLPRLLPQDAGDIFHTVLSTSHNGPLTFWLWIRQHWTWAANNYGNSNQFGKRVEFCISRIRDQTVLQEIRVWIDSESKVDSSIESQTTEKPALHKVPLMMRYMQMGLERADAFQKVREQSNS